MPESLGPFRLLRQLGAGGMGTVYLGERTEQFTQQVAIKILHPQLFPELADASIQREAKLLAALDHSGIVRMLDLGISSTNLRYIVMEYVDGLPLDNFCDKHKLPIKRRIEILLDIFDAVEYAHRHLVIHADLKPENILVTTEGKTRLLDFGVAAVVTELGADLTNPASFTPLFASPEHISGERLTVASDIYSLGLIAQSLLMGVVASPKSLYAARTTLPGMRSASTLKSYTNLTPELQNKIADRRITTPQSLISTLRGDLEAIFEKSTQHDPAQRFQSVQEMSDEFRRYLAGRPIQTRPAGPMLRAHKWVLRNRLVASMTLILLAALVFSGIGVVWRAREATRKRQIAQTRLHELVRLTDVLAGELYDSVHGLPTSEEAQIALLESAHQTIGKLAASVEDDPQLELELAQEYEKLIRLELGRVPVTSRAVKRASEDIEQEIELLGKLSAADPEVSRLQQQVPELIQLRDASMTHPKP